MRGPTATCLSHRYPAKEFNYKVTETHKEGKMAQPWFEPGSLTNRVSVLTTTLLNQQGHT